MRLIRIAAVIAAALLCAPFTAIAQTWPGTGPGAFPTISSVLGGERIPAEDTNGVTVDISPVQLEQFLVANGAILSFLPSPLVNGSCLSTNGTALLWQACGFGTVTSIGMTLPSWLAVSGSPITSAGTLAVTAAPGQTAGQVLATPALTTGSVGLRALVATDIPPVNLAGAGNGGVFGVLPIANGGTGTQVPSLIGGTNCTVTGPWPNQTISCTGGGGGGSGTVTTVSVAAANGLSGTVSSPTTTPVITLAPTFTGLANSNGTGFAPATSANIIGLWSGTCNSTTFLRADGTCQTGGGGGGGTVTSVGLTMPSIFTVTGSPITGAGSFGVSLASQSANQVLAAPNGSSGTPGYRALVAADIPTVLNGLTSASSLATVGTITSGVWNGSVLSPAYGGSGEAGTVTGILKANGASAYSAAASSDVLGLWSGTCNSSTYLRGDGSCQAPPGSGTVTSVALTAPSWLTVGGSPITGAGTLAVTSTSEPGNEVLASPNGSAGALAPRALVAADLPGTITSNTSGTAANITAASNSTLVTLSALSLPSTQITGLGTFATANAATPPAIGGTTPNTGAFTTLSLTTALSAANGGTGSGTAPNSGQIPIGNVGGTAYAPQSVSGDCALSNAGAITCTKTGGTAFSALATTTPGTGVATALGVNVGSAGSVVTNGGALGTPASGVATNLTGTASGLTAGLAQGLTGSPAITVSSCTGCSGGTVTDGAGTTTANELLLSSTTAHAYTNAVTLPAAAMPALGGDITSSAGSTSVTVFKVNGLAIPVSAACTGTNASGQFTSVSCGSGASAFSSLTGGTNTTAAMLIGTGASLGPTGTGTVNANEVNGSAIPTSASCLASNGSGVLIACTTTGIEVNGTGILGSPPNFTNSAATNGLTLTFTNASGGTIQLGLTGLPAMVANECLGVNSGGTAFAYLACSGGSGSGTVSSGTSGQVAYYAATGTTVSGETTITAAQSAAISGDVTKSAGSASATVTGVNGATVAVSAPVAATNSSGQIVAASTVTYLLDEGTKFTATGTGACATTSTLTGGTSVGSAVCTGATGASTLVITLPSAPNGIWICKAIDKTTTANTISETAYTATSATLSGTVTANDVIAFACMGS